jgi:uncharacterized protein (TIGR00251 family)
LSGARVADLLDAGGGDAVVHVHVQPRAGRDEVTGRHGDALRVRVRAPAVEGRATDAARRLVADAFGMAARDVELVSGERSRLKRFRLAGVPRESALVRLAALVGPAADDAAGGPGGSPA